MHTKAACILGFLVAVSALAATAQKAAQASSVSGKLSLITGSGDLKPARLAEVFLLPGDSEDSPAQVYLAAAKKKAETYSREEANRYPSEEADACEMVIIDRKAAHETLDALKESQFQRIQADEEGLFRFSTVQPGGYLVIAFGRAGFNEANWQKVVIVKFGEDVTLKLPSPSASCFMRPK